MRRATGGSSRSNSLRASSANSIFQAKAAFHLGEADGDGPPSSDIRQPLFGEMEVLQIAQIFDDRRLEIGFVASPGPFGKRVQALFDVVGALDGQHECLLRVAYTKRAARDEASPRGLLVALRGTTKQAAGAMIADRMNTHLRA